MKNNFNDNLQNQKKERKPYAFPEELPSKEQKVDHGSIVDVVVSEIKPQKAEQPIHEQQM